MRRLVIFDIDGTICDTNDVDDRCYLAAASTVLGLTPGELDWSDAPDITDSAILRWLGHKHLARDVSRAETAQVLRRFVNLLERERIDNSIAFCAIPGVAAFFDRLASTDWYVSFATGGWRQSAELKLRHIGIEPEDYVVATSTEAPAREDIVKLAISNAESRTGQRFSRMVSVGDGIWDVRTAAKLGLPFVGIAKGSRADQLTRAGAACVLADFIDQDAVLHALNDAPVPHNARVSV